MEGLEDWIPTWSTPGNQRDEIESVNTEVSNLDRDIASSSAPAAFRQSWATFRAEWLEFYEEQTGFVSWFSQVLTAAAERKAKDYRRQLLAWRQKFVELGGQSSSPGLVTPPSSSGSALKYVAITAGILAGLWVAHTAYREFRRVRGVVSA